MLWNDYLPRHVNRGPWITAHTLYHLRDLPPTEFVLPICSLAAAESDCTALGDYLLPPLYHEALDATLQAAIIERIQTCFPVYGRTSEHSLRVIELPRQSLPTLPTDQLLAFSVDTAVEEHGPQLPLGTDTIQSYGVLHQLASEAADVELAAPIDYGQLTWGLPFGFSIDLTADLLQRYVTRYVDALTAWRRPRAIYVVDVHGSLVHRQAIVAGLQQSKYAAWAFRWLHEPLAEFASARGDQHAGGVETTLVEYINPDLIDPAWWPERLEEIAQQQMAFEQAVALTPHLDQFQEYVRQHACNGVIGDIRNYHHLDAAFLFKRILDVAREDVEALRSGQASHSAGKAFW